MNVISKLRQEHTEVTLWVSSLTRVKTADHEIMDQIFVAERDEIQIWSPWELPVKRIRLLSCISKMVQHLIVWELCSSSRSLISMPSTSNTYDANTQNPQYFNALQSLSDMMRQRAEIGNSDQLKQGCIADHGTLQGQKDNSRRSISHDDLNPRVVSEMNPDSQSSSGTEKPWEIFLVVCCKLGWEFLAHYKIASQSHGLSTPGDKQMPWHGRKRTANEGINGNNK